MTPLRSIALLSTLITGVASAALGQPAGVTPPEDVFVEASLSADGIALSTDAVTLTRGGYYRLHLTCVSSDQGEPDFSFATDPLVRNSHLRVLTVDAIEVYVQGLSFRALQCEGAGSVGFSFYPLRAGSYEIEVSNDDAQSSFAVVVE